jgi:hypothetical protein
MRKRSALAIAGPARQPITPVGRIDVTCRPKIAAGRRVLETAFLDHQRRAAFLAFGRHLLGGLEDELHRAGELGAESREHRRDRHQDRDVRIVAARVHDAHRLAVPSRSRLRRERHRGALFDGQGVHVGTQRDDRTGLGAAQQPDDPGDADLGAHFVELERAQVRGDDRCGAHLAVAELGVLVDVASPRDEARDDGGDGGVDTAGERVGGVGGHGRLLGWRRHCVRARRRPGRRAQPSIQSPGWLGRAPVPGPSSARRSEAWSIGFLRHASNLARMAAAGSPAVMPMKRVCAFGPSARRVSSARSAPPRTGISTSTTAAS